MCNEFRILTGNGERPGPSPGQSADQELLGWLHLQDADAIAKVCAAQKLLLPRGRRAPLPLPTSPAFQIVEEGYMLSDVPQDVTKEDLSYLRLR